MSLAALLRSRLLRFVVVPVVAVAAAIVLPYLLSSYTVHVADVAIIFWRRMMMRMARDLEKGIEPAILSDPDNFLVLPLDAHLSEPDFGKVWEEHHNRYLATVGG